MIIAAAARQKSGRKTSFGVSFDGFQRAELTVGSFRAVRCDAAAATQLNLGEKIMFVVVFRKFFACFESNEITFTAQSIIMCKIDEI